MGRKGSQHGRSRRSSSRPNPASQSSDRTSAAGGGDGMDAGEQQNSGSTKISFNFESGTSSGPLQLLPEEPQMDGYFEGRAPSHHPLQVVAEPSSVVREMMSRNRIDSEGSGSTENAKGTTPLRQDASKIEQRRARHREHQAAFRQRKKKHIAEMEERLKALKGEELEILQEIQRLKADRAQLISQPPFFSEPGRTPEEFPERTELFDDGSSAATIVTTAITATIASNASLGPSSLSSSEPGFQSTLSRPLSSSESSTHSAFCGPGRAP